MKKLMLLACAALMTAAATAQEPQIPNYVEVTGVATTRVTPDKIEVSIRLNEADSKGKTTLAMLERSLATALTQAGVDIEKQLVVTEQSSAAQKRQNSYQYKSYRLTLSSAAEVATVFDLLDTNGIVNADVIQTSRTDIRQIEQKTKTEAIQNAQTTARTLAQAVGQTIGRAILIQDYSTPSYQPVARMLSSVSKSMGPEISADNVMRQQVQFEDIVVDQRITVRFVLE